MSGHRALTDNYLADTTVEDPGNAGTISIDRNPAVVELVSAEAETRTLADPRASGRVLTLVMKTDVGDIVVTASTAYDENGSTTITFANTGEFVKFVSIPDPASSGDYVWRVTSYDGATGPTINLATVDVDSLQIGGTAVAATAAELNASSDQSSWAALTPAADDALTLAEHGVASKCVLLSEADGTTFTLPAASGTGATYTVIVSTTVTSNSHIIKVANATDEFYGMLLQVDADTADALVAFAMLDADGFDTITMNGAATCGIKGDRFTFTDVAAGHWSVMGYMTGTGSVSTPLSAGVS